MEEMEAEKEEVVKVGGEEKVESEEQMASGVQMEATAPEEKAEEDEEEDPMAHLNAMRERMAAMAQMAEISNMQAALAQRVQASMQRIHSIMEEPQPATPSAAHHDEAEEWRRKIALLSAPCVPSPQGGAEAAGGAEAPPAFLLADMTSSPRQSEARQADVATHEAGGSSAAPQMIPYSPLQRGHGSEPRGNHADVAAREARPGEDMEVAAWRERIDRLSAATPPPADRGASLGTEMQEMRGEGSQHKLPLLHRLGCCWAWPSTHQYAPVEEARATFLVDEPQQGDSVDFDEDAEVTRL